MPVQRTHTAETDSADRIPSLDGLRAISIILVMAAHASWSNPRLKVLHHFALFGVRIFFVISGFLITGVMQRERLNTGCVALWSFYRRRFWRLMPAFYAYLLFALVMTLIGAWKLHLQDFLYAGFYLMNYYPGGGPWVLGHFWSLAVEEQFYLAWPVLFSSITLGKARAVLLMALLLAPLTRYVLFPSRELMGDTYGTMFPAVCDALATGCLLTLQRQQIHNNRTYIKLLRSNAYLVLLPLCAVLQLMLPPRLSATLGPLAMNLAIAILIDGCILFPKTAFTSLLNTRLAMLIGRMSYSLYLWQQPFFAPGPPNYVNRFPVSLLLAFTCAALSYCVIEKPLIEFGKKQRKSQIRVDTLVSTFPTTS